MQLRRFGVLTALSLIAACGDSDPTGVNAGVSGTVSFTYTGGGGGSFNAAGAILGTANPATANTTTWSTGWIDNSDATTNIEGHLATSGGLANIAAIVINRQTAGTATITADCDTANSACVIFLIGANQTTSQANFICALETGTVAIASISGTNATGSFSGTGTCLASGAGGVSAFTVTSGSFNVPLLTNVPAF